MVRIHPPPPEKSLMLVHQAFFNEISPSGGIYPTLRAQHRLRWVQSLRGTAFRRLAHTGYGKYKMKTAALKSGRCFSFLREAGARYLKKCRRKSKKVFPLSIHSLHVWEKRRKSPWQRAKIRFSTMQECLQKKQNVIFLETLSHKMLCFYSWHTTISIV